MSSLSLLTITGMAVVTYLTRFTGLWLMNRVKITPRLERWLKALPGTILVSIVAPTVFSSGKPEALAGLATALTAWFSKNLILAMIVGVAMVWALRGVL